jgi:hypothetical protein
MMEHEGADGRDVALDRLLLRYLLGDQSAMPLLYDASSVGCMMNRSRIARG